MGQACERVLLQNFDHKIDLLALVKSAEKLLDEGLFFVKFENVVERLLFEPRPPARLDNLPHIPCLANEPPRHWLVGLGAVLEQAEVAKHARANNCEL